MEMLIDPFQAGIGSLNDPTGHGRPGDIDAGIMEHLLQLVDRGAFPVFLCHDVGHQGCRNIAPGNDRQLPRGFGDGTCFSLFAALRADIGLGQVLFLDDLDRDHFDLDPLRGLHELKLSVAAGTCPLTLRQLFDDFHHRQMVEAVLGRTDFAFDPAGMPLLGFCIRFRFSLGGFRFVEDTLIQLVKQAELSGGFLLEALTGGSEFLSFAQTQEIDQLVHRLAKLFCLKGPIAIQRDDLCFTEVFQFGLCIKFIFLSVHAGFHTSIILCFH